MHTGSGRRVRRLAAAVATVGAAWLRADAHVVKAVRATGSAADDLAAWLGAHPTIEHRIVWVNGDRRREAFDQWSPAMKHRIEFFYQRMLAGTRNLQMHLPDPEKGKHQRIAADVAFDVYAAHVAHVVYVEAKHLVPWSIESRPAVELDQLLASSSYFARLKPSTRKYPPEIQANRDFQDAPEKYGTMSGYWRGMGNGSPAALINWRYDYELDGEPILTLAARHVVVAQLTRTLTRYGGQMTDGEMVPLPTFDEFNTRAERGRDRDRRRGPIERTRRTSQSTPRQQPAGGARLVRRPSRQPLIEQAA